MPRSFSRGVGTCRRALLEVFFPAVWNKARSMKNNMVKVKSCKNICVFTIGLHVDSDVSALRSLESCMDLRLGSCVVLRRGGKLTWNLILQGTWAPKMGPKLAQKAFATILEAM